jgi:hypothetical protein
LEQTNNLKLISVDKIAAMINVETNVSAKKWLLKNNIIFQKLGKHYYALEAEVKCEILMGYAKSIQKKYPEAWMELLKKIASDEIVYEMLLNKLSTEKYTQYPTTKLALKSKKEKELLKSIIN